MNLKELTLRQLKALLKERQSVSMGVKDIMFVHAVEDEIYRRTHDNC